MDIKMVNSNLLDYKIVCNLQPTNQDWDKVFHVIIMCFNSEKLDYKLLLKSWKLLIFLWEIISHITNIATRN